ncbi:MAG: undecaprenyl-diphosphatase [Alphaproteobacteria bacterium CG1_02_46_17]|nr:MAG: undecaprenyl-diphosphatase [Alphaproteobacteria bacterium CG1_02_46_17]
MIDYLHAFILGLVEGITEFLPISSTGHLILAGDALGFSSPIAKMFMVVIQLGAILAVCWLYRTKCLDVALHIHKRPQQIFVAKLLVAFFPAAIVGLAFHSVIEEKLFSPLIVAISLVIGGIAIWVIEKFRPEPVTHTIDDLTFKQAFWIGVAQIFSLIPGTSRSGATIMGGMIAKLDRKAATEFSFFLAIPVMFGATFLDVTKYATTLTAHDILLIAIGFVVSFFSGLVAIKFLVRYVSTHSFISFAIYRIIFGSAMIIYYLI